MTRSTGRPQEGRVLDLPSGLPDYADARLPRAYEEAKAALARCANLDECKSWADKAAALASYARQSEDTALERFAMRVRARAIRRCGILLLAIADTNRGRPAKGNSRADHGNLTRTAAASAAGLGEHKQRVALELATIPTDEFERALETDHPPTVSALAKQGTTPRADFDLGGRDPADFKQATKPTADCGHD